MRVKKSCVDTLEWIIQKMTHQNYYFLRRFYKQKKKLRFWVKYRITFTHFLTGKICYFFFAKKKIKNLYFFVFYIFFVRFLFLILCSHVHFDGLMIFFPKVWKIYFLEIKYKNTHKKSWEIEKNIDKYFLTNQKKFFWRKWRRGRKFC